MDKTEAREIEERGKKTTHTRDNLKDEQNTDPTKISCVWGGDCTSGARE
jgi:hypothetical protein